MAGGISLRSGARIAVIGGGPAGCFFSHFAFSEAKKEGLDISITIFDGKNFQLRGPRGCNLCAGVIASTLEKSLKAEGIFLPEKRIINRIDGYSLHVEKETLGLACSENGRYPIATVFRGNGPRYSCFPDVVSFDDFLLSWAQDRGARVVPEPILKVELPARKNAPVILRTGRKTSPAIFEADLIVGAFGVNSLLTREFQRLNFGYVPPRTLTTFQAEFKLERHEVKEVFRNQIHVYMPRSGSLRYATIIPKGDYITVTLIGKKDAGPELLEEFREGMKLEGRLTFGAPQCLCYPKIVVSAAKRPYGDRVVLIGDSNCCRHYKNGLESAFLTARLAAEAAFTKGVDRASFAEGYDRPTKKLIVRDNFYGRVLFRVNDFISSVPLLARAHLNLAKRDCRQSSGRMLRSILWSMFTGEESYRNIIFKALDIRLQIALIRNTIYLLFWKIKKSFHRSSLRKNCHDSRAGLEQRKNNRYHRLRPGGSELRHQAEEPGNRKGLEDSDHRLRRKAAGEQDLL